MATSSLTFASGMNTDTVNAFRSPDSYLEAKNFTFTSEDGNTVGSLEAVKGNELVPSLDFGTGQEVVGYADVVRDLVFFTTDGSISKIWHYSDSILTEKYSDELSASKLNLSLDPKNRVVAIGRQELTDLEKVYWVDGVNELRYIDLSKDYSGAEATVFNSIPPNDLTATIESTALPRAGNYLAGTVYHAYQFYTLNGASSTISQASFPVKLSEYTNIKDGGTDSGEDSGCAVEVTIEGISPSVLEVYNRVRLFAILFESSESPVINIVAEKSLSSDSITFIDTGDSIGTYTLDQFVSANQTSYIPEAIASKDNHLFIGNLTEETFSDAEVDAWDARAYRFDDNQIGRIYNAAETEFIDVSSVDFTVASSNIGLVVGSDIPEDFDCKNIYNNIYDKSLALRLTQDNYRYQSDGTTIGGEGVNVSYVFEDLYRSVDTNAAGGIRESNTFAVSNQSDIYYTDAARTVEHGLHIECEPGEVYRVGIRFFNSKGQSSFVKWVGDILWEEAGYTKCSLDVGDDHAVSLSKALKVTVSNLPSSVSSWQIVRAERKAIDRSVVATGQLRQTVTDTVDSVERPDNFNSVADHEAIKQLYRFISPELMYNSTGVTTSLEGYKLRVYNMQKGLVQDEEVDTGSGGSWGQAGKQNAFARKFNTIEDRILNTGFLTVDSSRWVTPIHSQDNVADRVITIGGYQYINQYGRQYFNPAGSDDYSGGCSTMVVSPSGQLSIDSSELTETEAVFHASLIGNKDLSRYGGVTFQDIQNTEYIAFSNIFDAATLEGIADMGDSYTSPFYFMESLFWDRAGDSEDSGYILASFITTSSIDLRRRNDRLLDYVNGLDSILGSTSNDDGYMHPQETVVEGIEFQGTTYDTTIGDLYLYNPAYSADNISTVSFSKPFDFIESQHSPTKILASEKKINGEAEDQWTNFLPNNFIEVDNAYGPLNTLKKVDSTMFFWQDKAFGILAVNDRSVISTDSGSKLALGTGGVLERYDYISNEVGNIDKYNVTTSENGIYWVYSPKSTINLYDSQVKELSTSSAIQGYLRSKGEIINPISITDFRNNESLFKLNDEVVVYDWFTNKFTSIYTYNPEWFFKLFDGNYMSSGDSQTIYEHNSDTVNRANFYGVDNKSTIQHVLTENYPVTKVFDTISWDSTSKDSNDVVLYDNTFDRYRFTNDYQNTDWQTIDWKRKERSFTSIVPRDRVNAPQSSNVDIFNPSNLDSTQTYKRRMRDKYIILDMEYDNSTGNKFSIPYINVNYRQSIR